MKHDTMDLTIVLNGTSLTRRFSGDQEFYDNKDWNDEVEGMCDSIKNLADF